MQYLRPDEGSWYLQLGQSLTLGLTSMVADVLVIMIFSNKLHELTKRVVYISFALSILFVIVFLLQFIL